jgi:hypothetical protein
MRAFPLACVTVFASVGGAFLFDSLGMQSAARIFLLPVCPVLLALVALAGGFRNANGEWRIVPIAGVLSIALWWIVLRQFAFGDRATKRRG